MQGLGTRGYFEYAIIQYPAANLAFTAASIAREERRAVHHDCYAAPAFFGVLHASEHVLEKEQLAVVDARGASAKTTGGTPIFLSFYSGLVHFPFFAVKRISE